MLVMLVGHTVGYVADRPLWCSLGSRHSLLALETMVCVRVPSGGCLLLRVPMPAGMLRFGRVHLGRRRFTNRCACGLRVVQLAEARERVRVKTNWRSLELLEA